MLIDGLDVAAAHQREDVGEEAQIFVTRRVGCADTESDAEEQGGRHSAGEEGREQSSLGRVRGHR